MKPDFSKSTIEILAKRAAFECSNPDCRVTTVGPTDDTRKATIIGEAAHIFGARRGSKRYQDNMTDLSRSGITNAIWLCRNCHKLIDSDELRYSTDLLFSWREIHEKYAMSKIGNNSDKLIQEKNDAKVEPFKDYPPIIRRIVLDEPPGWEWRIASELLIFLNSSAFRKLEALQDRLYTKPLEPIELEDFPKWIQLKLAEFENLCYPYEGLLARLSDSFGEPGVAGDLIEIHYVCKLIKNYLDQVIVLEESLHFVYVPNECEGALDLLRNLLGSQAMKLADLPKILDNFLVLATSEAANNLEDKIVRKTIKLDVPDGWSENLANEVKKIYEKIEVNGI